MSVYKQHPSQPQPDAGRSGKRPKLPRGWQRPDEPRPGPRHPRREAMRARALAQLAAAEVTA